MSARLMMFFFLFCVPTLPGLLLGGFLLRKRTQIGRNSVKYAIDYLSEGIAFYAPDGMLLLSNRVMNGFCERITRKPLLNCEQFRERLYEEGMTQENPVVTVPEGFLVELDERMYRVEREKITVYGQILYQLTVIDVTELHESELRLREETVRLQNAQEQLKTYDREAEELAKSEAFLAAKTRIHDMLGQELLATRYFLTKPQGRLNREELLSGWEKVLRELSLSEEETLTQLPGRDAVARDMQQGLIRAAQAIGLTLFFAGEFPSDSAKLTRLIMSCARVCMTNAVRHGGASEMTIGFEQNPQAGGEGHTIVFSNNGEVPQGAIVKGGGLESLETIVREAQGSVEYRYGDVFRVVVHVGSI